ncbi:MAG: hypothetical protein IPJ32_21645 [Sphingobacteriaceae bacterium]|nr:hypothetical protein [Sphingobacteriaceae bacterium]
MSGKISFLENKLKEERNLYITFDDNLKSQYEIAFTGIKKFNLKAFWFIYTSPFEGILERIEVYRF